ncbi:hypothetical protein NMD29_25145 (plasmid) [Escherichia coli]|uniref:hypothetical protein n=1 Tax=Escherichia coli TaxID=562 RepID=UPI00351D40B6
MRFFPRAVLLEVGEDGADGGGFLDAGDDPHGATAVDAGGEALLQIVGGDKLIIPFC